MELAQLKGVLEGLLFASGDEGISMAQIKKVLSVNGETAEILLEELKYDYEHGQRGLSILEQKGVYYLTTKSEHALYFEKMQETNSSSKLSQAALETLAIIAYQQPITRVEIEDIRGVKSDGPIQTLVSRFLIEECGRKETSGRPILFQTTKEFLTFFGLTSLDELPPLPDENFQEAVQDADLFFNDMEEPSA
ncbi:SMC-Scp complex subunit ScpB [Alkalibacillus haloalkaliphilus]|uniref:Segregation and condensation protein B n=1 Tax=Alkalibacillus haloalkaliphilus TaxID=94136 RepID=A0A511W2A2_9BACI|nr:SMC-Scp complex subunit ScpB [Alkalibacillus haloalkaliphilus]MDV2580867.1 SMC-Scp complex subunit ScpB [Alkalibacillus haloalkaliphilus]GEN45196.1 segregation and condensation protein B [Alkalibacillus haloalkaliphilus]